VIGRGATGFIQHENTMHIPAFSFLTQLVSLLISSSKEVNIHHRADDHAHHGQVLHQ
jgi:hypothetical protein